MQVKSEVIDVSRKSPKQVAVMFPRLKMFVESQLHCVKQHWGEDIQQDTYRLLLWRFYCGSLQEAVRVD